MLLADCFFAKFFFPLQVTRLTFKSTPFPNCVYEAIFLLNEFFTGTKHLRELRVASPSMPFSSKVFFSRHVYGRVFSYRLVGHIKLFLSTY